MEILERNSNSVYPISGKKYKANNIGVGSRKISTFCPIFYSVFSPCCDVYPLLCDIANNLLKSYCVQPNTESVFCYKSNDNVFIRSARLTSRSLPSLEEVIYSLRVATACI